MSEATVEAAGDESRPKMSETVIESSCLISKLHSERRTILVQLQSCITPLCDALVANGVLDKDTVTNIALVQDELDDPTTAAETLYDALVGKAETDPTAMKRFMEAAEKVVPAVFRLLIPEQDYSLLARLLSGKRNVLRQLQACVKQLSEALIANAVLDEETMKTVTLVHDELNDPATAAESLYDAVVTKSATDLGIAVKFVEAAEKVAPAIADVLKSSRIALTYELLTNRRDKFIELLDPNAIIEACALEGIINQQQYKALDKLRELGKPREFVADRFVRVLEKTAENERVSKLEAFETILLTRHPDVLSAVLESGDRTTTPSLKRQEFGSSASHSLVLCPSSLSSAVHDEQMEVESPVTDLLHVTDCDETFTLKLDFHNILIGNGRPPTGRDESLSTVELSKLSPAKIVQLYRNCEGRGFATALKPYLIDLLKRRETFQTVLDMFVAALNEEEKSNESYRDNALPHFLLELSPKDIFVALLEVTSEAAHGRLVALYATLNCAIPLVYVLQPSTQQRRTVINFSALQELLAGPSYPLVVSCGSKNAIGRGKSNLTGKLVGQLHTSSLSSDSFDIQTSGGSGGPTHSPSIDLALDVKANVKGGLNFADVHGFTLEQEFCRALSTLCSVAALVLVHITIEDFDSSGSLGDGLTALILKCCSLHLCDARVVFFVRDVPARSSTLGGLMTSVRHSFTRLLPNKVAEIVAVENLQACRTDNQRQKTVVRIKDQLTLIFQKLRQKLPCFEAINERYVSTIMAGPQQYRRQFGDMEDGFSELGRQVCEILEQNKPTDGRLVDRLFPLTAIFASIARNRQREKQFLESEVQSTQVRSELADLASELRQMENFKFTCPVSKPVQFFAAVIKQESYCRIGEFQHYLEVWKAQYVNPLLAERRDLMDQLQSAGHASRDAAESRQTDERHDALKRKLDVVSVQIDQLDISIDSFWSELMEFCDLQEDDTACYTLRKSCDLDPALAKRVYTQCVVEGYPMQLLRGNPLQMTANKFLQDVLTQLHVKSENNLVVVSVIGVQSSAKSTLLNYLFGCGFATRAGRCTKGLYASYVSVSDGRRLLILDSEGLLSLEGGGHVFDGQITVMAMACSDVVIVNHKGEISSQLKELLEVCLYAMDYLKVAAIRPEMMFVLRDQRDRDTRVQLDTLTLMKKLLKDAVGNSQMNFDDLVSLRKDAIFLLPSAFSEQKRDGRTVEWPSAVFAEETFSLRQRMLGWAQEAQSAADSSSHEDISLLDWYNRSCTVWEILTTYGHTLLHYKALYELRLHKEMTDLVEVIVKEVVESDTGLAGQASQVVKKHTSRLRTAKDERTVETHDRECRSELTSLREHCHKEIISVFDARTDAKKYNEDLKQKFRMKLVTPVTHVYEFHVYTWQMQLRVTSDRLNIEAVDRHFTLQTSEVLKSSEYQAAMSQVKAMELFEELWEDYETEHRRRLNAARKSSVDIEQEISEIFKAVLTRHRHDNEMLSVVSVASLQNVSERHRTTRFVNRDNEAWFRSYLEITPAHIGRRAYDAVTGLLNLGKRKNILISDVVCNVVPEVKRRIESLIDNVRAAVGGQDGKLDAAIVTNIVIEASEAALDIERRYLFGVNTKLKLRRAHFVNDLFIYLQQMVVKFATSADENCISKDIQELEKKKQRKKQNFLDMVSEDADDVQRARAFADSYNEMLEIWVTSKVLEFTSQVRDQVLKDMPNPEQAAHRAYKTSFERGNYSDVLEYCLNVNAYLKKLFIRSFDQQEQAAIDRDENVLRDDVSAVYRTIAECAERWQKSLGPVQSFPFIERIHLNDFKEFLQLLSSDSSQPADVRAHRMAAMTNFPEVANFGIARVEVFCQAFVKHIRKLLSKASETLDDKVATAMKKERHEVWMKVKGCTAKCPLCGSKCSLVNDHVDHECAHHLIPAFHGTAYHETNLPVFDMCQSKENACVEWYRGDDPPQPNLAAWLDFYSDYRAWKNTIIRPGLAQKHVPEEQMQAWVNCKIPLLAHWNFVDQPREEWSCYQSSSPLDVHESTEALKRLQAFKDIIM